MNTSRLGPIVLAASFPLLLAGCQTSSSIDLSTPPAPVAGYSSDDFYWGVYEDNGVFVAGQPSEQALRRITAERGVTTVVNLRTPAEMSNRAQVPYDEAAAARSLNVDYVEIPMNGSDEFPYAPDAVDRFAEAMDNAEGPVLLHCRSAGRASHLWAAYLTKYRGVAPADAYARGQQINLQPSIYDRFVGEGPQSR
ncbi:MAG: sulfur transferase domain-containing protein [Planctomycetota bacterium]